MSEADREGWPIIAAKTYFIPVDQAAFGLARHAIAHLLLQNHQENPYELTK